MKKEQLGHRVNHKKRDQVCGTPIVTIFYYVVDFFRTVKFGRYFSNS